MEEEADKIFHLYLQKLSGTLSAEEESYVQQQLDKNTFFYAQWSLLEQESEAMKATGYLNALDSAAQLEALKAARLRPVARGFAWKGAAAAAAILLLLATGAYFLFFREKYNPAPLAAAVTKKTAPVKLTLGKGEAIILNKDSNAHTITLNNATLSTANGALQYTSADTLRNILEIPPGEQYKLTLSDGTIVWLNAATKLSFPFRFGRAAREVFVEGEAFFQVAKDAAHPFIVHTPLTSVQVLGTSFNINTYHTGTVQTALVEGSVVTESASGQKQQLKPGYQAAYQPGKGFTTGTFEEEEVLSWRTGIYYYHEMSLPDLLATASRFYGISFVLEGEKYAGKTLTGLMDRQKPADFLADLQATAHIHYRYAGNEVYLK